MMVGVRFVLVNFFLVAALWSPPTAGQSADEEDISQYAPSPGLFKRLEEPTDKTIDQLITEALGGVDVASNKILAPGAYVLAELDMFLSQDQFLSLYEPPSNHIDRGSNGTISRASPPTAGPPGPPGPPAPPPSPPPAGRPKRKAARDVILRWPGAEVPYQLARGHFSPKERYVLKQAMTEWERYTCLKFRPATNADVNVVRFQNGEGCNSQLGMVGGVQLLNLDVSGCRFKGLYLHEIGHAVGLVHEHQLPDRDHYISILLHNVAPHFRIFFNKYSPAVVNQFHVPYQYSSVMHYGITAFSYNGQAQTISTLDRSKEDSIGKVYLKELAFSDVKVVNEMYSCNAFCPDVVRCENNGYLDENCHCVCPDGSSSCEVRLDSNRSNNNRNNNNNNINNNAGGQKTDENCRNKYDNWKCAVWANQGECERNPHYMNTSCARACGLCDKKTEDEKKKNHFTTWAWQWFGMFTNLFPKEWMIGVCKDVYSYAKCHKWRQQGDCVTNPGWMKDNCKMTCNFCGNPALRAETSCRNQDSDSECDKWALDGECILNADWMKEHCPKSCHACVENAGKDGKEEEEEEEEEDEEAQCLDKHDSRKCQQWARAGECSNNPTWMIANCRRSCAKCDDGTCKNLYDDTQCRVWAQDMECMKNREWMHTHCSKACGVCDSNDSDTADRPDVRDEEDEGEEREDEGRDTDVTRRPDVDSRTTSVYPTWEPDTDTCFNSHNAVECRTWADTGHCDINPRWMHKNCAKACKQCDKDTGRTHEVCGDLNAGCQGWANHGFCDSNPRYNLIYCKKSCNNCNGCRDQQFLCKLWAKAGHCKTNAGYMLRQCQRSCKTCQ